MFKPSDAIKVYRMTDPGSLNPDDAFSAEFIPVAVGIFSGGEVQVRVDPHDHTETYVIVAKVFSSNDLMELLLVTESLRRSSLWARIILSIPYLPYARQDRACAEGEAFSLKVFTSIINAQKYAAINVWDCHSDVGLALLDNVMNIDQVKLTESIPMENTILVAPDAGSLKKVMSVAKARGVPFIRADKSRDPVTGQITGSVVYSEHVGDKNLLILDDICDGGRTFTSLAQSLRPLTSGLVNLYVTHGIFSQGFSVVGDHFDTVYCANPFKEIEDRRFLQVTTL